MNTGCYQCAKKKALIKKLREENLILRKEISAMLKDARQMFNMRNKLARELVDMQPRAHREYSRYLKDESKGGLLD